jgi:hypothetical protein
LESGDWERTWSRSPSSPSKPDSEFFLDGAEECALRPLGLVSCSNAVDIVVAGGADREGYAVLVIIGVLVVRSEE